MPEARLTLAHATIALAVAPKSNAVTTAIGAAIADVRAGKIGPVPAAPARRALRRRQEARPRRDVQVQPRRAVRHRRAAVRPRRRRRRRVLPADRARRRGRDQGALGAGPPAHPRRGRSAVRVLASSTSASRTACAAMGRCVADACDRRRRARRGAALGGARASRVALRRARAAAGRELRAAGVDGRRPGGRRRAASWTRAGSVRRLARPTPDAEFVITDLGRRRRRRARAEQPRPTVDRALFADLVLRETRGEGGVARPRRTPGARPGDAQPDPVRDAARGQAGPQAAPRRHRGRPAASGRPASAPTSTTDEGTPHETRSGSSPGPAPASTRWCGAGAPPRRSPSTGCRTGVGALAVGARTVPRRGRPGQGRARKPSCASGSVWCLMEHPSSTGGRHRADRHRRARPPSRRQEGSN